jgi:hypothetical protein
MTSASWGVWHDKILLGELLDFPVAFCNKGGKKIIEVVNKLMNYMPSPVSYQKMEEMPCNKSKARIDSKIDKELKEIEGDLDNAVFEYYGMTDDQKDLVLDFCNTTLPFFYEPYDSIGTLELNGADLDWLQSNYINVFAKRWNAYLDEDSRIDATIHSDTYNTMIAIEFYPVDKTDRASELFKKYYSWNEALSMLVNSTQSLSEASQITVDGVYHIVSSTAIVVIKRNERRLWTRSLAREDVDITLIKYMTEIDTKGGGES